MFKSLTELLRSVPRSDEGPGNRGPRCGNPLRSRRVTHKARRATLFESLEPRLLLYNVSIAADDFAATHEAMTAESLALYYDLQETPTTLAQEIRFHAGVIFEGVKNPDEYDPFYGNSGVAGSLVTISHFWSPDTDLDAPMEFDLLGGDDYPNAFGAAQAAWSRALGEYSAGNKLEAYRYLGMVAHFLGDQSIPTHAHGDTHGPDFADYDAFEEWMSVANEGNSPTGTAAVLAGVIGPFGVARSRAFLTPDESAGLRANGLLNPQPQATEINDQLLWLFLNTNQVADFFASDGIGVVFPVDGNAVHPSDPRVPWINGWAQASLDNVASASAAETNRNGEAGGPTAGVRLIDNHGVLVIDVNDNDGDLSLIRKYSYLNGVQALGGLFKLWEQAISTPIVTVTINRIEEVGHEPIIGPTFGMDQLGKPDFYVGTVMGYNRRVRSDIPVGAYLHDRDGNIRDINGAPMAANLTRRDAFRTAEQRGTEDQSEVSPNYRFGQSNLYPAGTHAYVPGVDVIDVSLVVWENDEFPTSVVLDPYTLDDPAEIDGDRHFVNLTIDLAGIVAGTPGAITAGTTQHTVNTIISKSGTGNDEDDVRVSFTVSIFVPNRPPNAEAGGPYTVNEGSSVQLSGAGSSDPDQAANTLTYAWDLDNNGSFETAGISPNFAAIDGPATRTVRLRVTDSGGLSAIDEATINIRNVDPVVTATGATIDENGVATVSGTIADPGVLDFFTVLIDWGEGSPGIYTYPAGTTTFSETRQYLDDNPIGTASDNYPIGVTVVDKDGGIGTASTVVTVNNVAAQFANVAVTAEIDENGVATLSGNIVDPGTQDTFTLVVDWGEGSPRTYTYPAGTTSFVETHQYLDDNPTATSQDVYSISLSLADDDSGTASAAASTLVKNVVPVIAASTSDAVECGAKREGDTVHVTGSFTDVGTLDTHSATISWGDGTTTVATIGGTGGVGTIAGEHVYASGGIFRITITLTDDDTGQTTDQTFALITGVGILDGQLQAVGTEEADEITISRLGRDEFMVRASFLPDSPRKYSAAGVTSIAMILCGGDDKATIASTIDLPTYITAEEGDDEINGGSGPNILLGGEGDDNLRGGSSHDILVGGDGADRIVANGGDDILIAGTLGGAADPIDQLDLYLALLMEWHQDRNREELRPKLVLGGDDDADKLTGSAGVDWYFYELGDVATDQKNEPFELLPRPKRKRPVRP